MTEINIAHAEIITDEDAISSVIREVQRRFPNGFSDENIQQVMDDYNIPASKLSQIHERFGRTSQANE